MEEDKKQKKHSDSEVDNEKEHKQGFLFKMIKSLIDFLHTSTLTSRPTIEAIGKIRLYRHTDYGLLVSASMVGILIGVFVAVFHYAMLYGEELFRLFGTKSGEIIPWQIITVPLIPAIGGFGVGVLKQTLFRGTTMEGIHTVVDALIHRDGRIDWRNSFKSILFAALSISSGGGAGREGPTIVLGASIGSTLAQILRLRPQQLRVLCGSGAAAAISGIFNAPLGGIVFALEAIIGEISISTFVPLVISSVLATATSRLLVGDHPLLFAPNVATVTLTDYFFLAVAGIMSGYVSLYFLKVYYSTAGIVNRTLKKVPSVWKPAIGGLAAGILLLILPTLLETTYNPVNYAISGRALPLMNGTIFERLSYYLNSSLFIWLTIGAAGAVVLLKPVSNAVTLASGGAGGTMAPVIKAGAMFGFCFGLLLRFIYPNTSPGLYALVCAGAVFSGTYQAPLTGGIVLFEISRNYNLILPLVFSSVFSSFIVQHRKVRTFNPLREDVKDQS